jgi:hypothetical protein
MSRTRSIRRLLIAALFATYAALPGAWLYAHRSYIYNLDSLVQLSPEVAEVEITRRFRVQDIDVIGNCTTGLPAAFSKVIWISRVG